MSVCERVWGIHIKIKTHRIIGGRNAELLNMGGSCSCYPELSISTDNPFLFFNLKIFLSHPVFYPSIFCICKRVRRLEQDPPIYYHIAIFIASVYFWVILMGITFSHTLVTTSKMSIGFLSKIDAALLCSRNK